MQIWQATSWEIDRHLKRLVALWLRRKAKQHKIILRAMMQIAVRHGALETTPVDGVGAFARRRTPARGVLPQTRVIGTTETIACTSDPSCIPTCPTGICPVNSSVLHPVATSGGHAGLSRRR